MVWMMSSSTVISRVEASYVNVGMFPFSLELITLQDTHNNPCVGIAANRSRSPNGGRAYSVMHLDAVNSTADVSSDSTNLFPLHQGTCMSLSIRKDI